jgi:hypothetical protein
LDIEKILDFAESDISIHELSSSAIKSVLNQWWRESVELKMGQLCLFIAVNLGKITEDEITRTIWSAGNVMITIENRIVRVMVDGMYVYDADKQLCVPGNWINCIVHYIRPAKLNEDDRHRRKEVEEYNRLLGIVKIPKAKW